MTGYSDISHGSDGTLYLPIDDETVSLHGIFQQFNSYPSLHGYSCEEVVYESCVKFVAFLVNIKVP